VVHANKLVNHVEGGWPKEIDCTDAEHTIRYRKKVIAPHPCSSPLLKAGISAGASNRCHKFQAEVVRHADTFGDDSRS
jgi:hypothetical protein